jgi:hypothetical protein
MSAVVAAITYRWKNNQYICEIYDAVTKKWISCGIGPTKKLAESRAYANPQVKYTPYKSQLSRDQVSN